MNLLLLFPIIIVIIVFILYYIGFFDKPETCEKIVPAFTLAYIFESNVEPSQIPKLLQKIGSLVALYKRGRAVAIYHVNPFDSNGPNTFDLSIGFVIRNSQVETLKKEIENDKESIINLAFFEEQKAIVSSLQYKTFLTPIYFGPTKCYSAISNFVQDSKLKMKLEGPAMEFYDNEIVGWKEEEDRFDNRNHNDIGLGKIHYIQYIQNIQTLKETRLKSK